MKRYNVLWNTQSKAANTPKKSKPVETMLRFIFLVIMKSSRRRGLSPITFCEGGNDASAIAANVSMMRFTQSICVTVSGDCSPVNAPVKTIKQATTLTISWNSTKR